MNDQTEIWVQDPRDGQVVEKREDGTTRVYTVNVSPSRTQQADAEKADIRNILRKYEVTGIVDHMRDVDLQFRDITEFDDLADALQQAKEAEYHFMQLPSKLREVFDHDVAKWLDAAHDADKLEALRPQLEALGVMEPLPEEPAPVAPVEPAPTTEPEETP